MYMKYYINDEMLYEINDILYQRSHIYIYIYIYLSNEYYSNELLYQLYELTCQTPTDDKNNIS